MIQCVLDFRCILLSNELRIRVYEMLNTHLIYYCNCTSALLFSLSCDVKKVTMCMGTCIILLSGSYT